MATRNTPGEIDDLIQTSVGEQVIDRMIVEANGWVDDNLLGDNLSASTLKSIEAWLTCYFITIRDPRLTSAKFDDVSENFQRDPKTSEYLKAAIARDPTGKVEAAFMSAGNGSSNRVRFRFGQSFQDEYDAMEADDNDY